MTKFNDSWLIRSTVPEILLGPGLFFCLADLISFTLSAEDGNYRQLLR